MIEGTLQVRLRECDLGDDMETSLLHQEAANAIDCLRNELRNLGYTNARMDDAIAAWTRPDPQAETLPPPCTCGPSECCSKCPEVKRNDLRFGNPA